MSKLLLLLATVALAVPTLHAQVPTYVRGDIVRLVSPDANNTLPDSRIVAVAGDRISLNTSALTVNGEAVKDVPPAILSGITEPWEQTIPVGHYFVIGHKQLGPNSLIGYHGLIPAEKIVRKVTP